MIKTIKNTLLFGAVACLIYYCAWLNQRCDLLQKQQEEALNSQVSTLNVMIRQNEKNGTNFFVLKYNQNQMIELFDKQEFINDHANVLFDYILGQLPRPEYKMPNNDLFAKK